MKTFTECVFAVLLGLTIVMAVGCSEAPIKKGCSEIGATADGEKLFKDCQDI